jgi:hypothetical protein
MIFNDMAVGRDRLLPLLHEGLEYEILQTSTATLEHTSVGIVN